MSVALLVERTPLPYSIPSFRSDLKILMSLSQERIAELLNEFKVRGTETSTKRFASITGIGISEAHDIRILVLVLVDMVNKYPKEMESIQKDLVSGGAPEEFARALLSSIVSMDENAKNSASALLGIDRYAFYLSRLSFRGTELNHTIAGEMGETGGIMFPMVRVLLSSKGNREDKDMELNMNAEEFETFVIEFENALHSVRKEAGSLKKVLGNKYTTLIGESE